MKKVGLLTGLGALATIGGVFAAWTFGSVQFENPEDLVLSNISIDTVIKTGFKITASGEQTDATYYIQQNSGKNGLELVRSSATSAENDVNITVTLSDDETDAYEPEITTTKVAVTAKVVFTKEDPDKDCLLDLEGAVVNEKVVLEEEVTMSADHLVDTSLGFVLAGSGALNESYSITTASAAQAYINALGNTNISIAISLAEVTE